MFQGVQVPHTVRSFPEIVREWIHFFYSLRGAKRLRALAKIGRCTFQTTIYNWRENARSISLDPLSAAEIYDSERVKVEIELWEKGPVFHLHLCIVFSFL